MGCRAVYTPFELRYGVALMDARLVALYHRHVAAAYDQQLRLGDFLDREAAGAALHYQVSTATLSFGPAVKFRALDLGSHSTIDNSWLWGWCGTQLNLAHSAELRRGARDLAARTGVAAFTAAQAFDVGPVLGDDLGRIVAHVFGIVASAELGFQGYYTVPYRSGRSTVLLRDDRLKAAEPDPVARVATIFPQVLTGFPILDHRAALLGYLAHYGVAPTVEGRAVVAAERGTEALRAEFDDLNRLTNLTGTVQGTG
ncbi:Uncharacterized protein OS=Rhodopirellula sp. SWK7 GN=RRSWK_03814 PE=4 SV=1 [Gemmataceae bacterium]|nr:Uncharacterized protein OS=Rhodopirellula sp. SWK7 GN=RRSWK_03814 PE=4 SV=1 [Gemmataceae bacterium]VTU00536.1 Uncharacterized protein OS=Rhodopirellula sp. SWK7 GN=RRSWK_03814 PE=4 SV=1 [Gemmataceae bacterium]